MIALPSDRDRIRVLYGWALAAALSLVVHSSPAADTAWPWAKYGIPPSTGVACIPTPRTDWAAGYHKGMLAREKRPDLKVVFLGDSITMMWRTQSGYEGGTPVWQKQYAALRAGNFGISGDRTEHVLWRITAGGDLDGLRPKVLVLLIGINNLLGGKQTPEQTAAGTTTIVHYLKAKLSSTKILLLGVFPCWEKPSNPVRAKIRRLNELIRPLEDLEQVFYLDIGDRFLEPDGTIRREKLRDLLHLSEIGYGIWAEAMRPFLADLLENDGKGPIWKARTDGKPARLR